MVVPSAETDFVGDFRRKTYHLLFSSFFFYIIEQLSTRRSVEYLSKFWWRNLNEFSH